MRPPVSFPVSVAVDRDESPSHVDCLRDAHPRRGDSWQGSLGWQQAYRSLAGQIDPVLRRRQPESLGELTGSVRQVPVSSSPGLHVLDAHDRSAGAQEHGGAVSFRPGHNVHTPVHAVGAVYVQVAGRPEHGRCSRRRAAERV